MIVGSLGLLYLDSPLGNSLFTATRAPQCPRAEPALNTDPHFIIIWKFNDYSDMKFREDFKNISSIKGIDSLQI